MELCGALKVGKPPRPRPRPRPCPNFSCGSPEYRGSGCWLLRWSGLWGQHQGSGDPTGPDGDGRLRQDVLQRPGQIRHLPGELRRGRPGHHLLRRTQPQSSRGLCQNLKGPFAALARVLAER